jgi:hypothetical protein
MRKFRVLNTFRELAELFKLFLALIIVMLAVPFFYLRWKWYVFWNWIFGIE